MSKVIFEEQASPSTPATDRVGIYPKAGGQMYKMSDDGSEKQIIDTSDSASETAEGISELATDAETITGTATDRVVTPANIVAREKGVDIDRGGYYDLQLQNIPDLASKGAGYWFTTDDKITVSNNSAIDLTTHDFSFVIEVRPDKLSIAEYFIVKHQDANDNWYFRQVSNGKVNFFVETGNTVKGNYETTDPVLTEGAQTVIALTSDRDGGAAGQKIYINGESVSVYEATAMEITSLTNTGDMVFGNRLTSYYTGAAMRALQFNLVLTAAEVKAFSSGAPVPYKYIGAKQTELMPNQVDRDFSGASAWADVDLVAGGGAYDETTDLTITAGGAGAADYCTCPVASAPTTIGKRYRMTYDLANLVGSWTVKSFDGTQTIGTISANATQGTLEWTAETTGGYRLIAAVNSASGDFDNFTLTQIGCVLQLEQDGITGDEWIDKSGNGLNGIVSGAIPVNLEVPEPIYISAREFLVTTGTLGEINGTGQSGHSMTDGELSTVDYLSLHGFDVNRPVYAQVVWCSIDGTPANGVTWLVTYDHDAIESGVLTTPATALDTVIAEDAENDTPYTVQKTAKGVINAGTLTAGSLTAFRVEADVVDSGNDPGCWFMGLLLSQ